MNKISIIFTVAAAACHVASADLDVAKVDVEDLITSYEDTKEGDVRLYQQGMIEVDFSSRSPKGEALCPSGWKVGYPSFVSLNIGEYYFGEDCIQMNYGYDSSSFASENGNGGSDYYRTCADDGHGDDSAFLVAHSQWYADADGDGSLPLEDCFKRAKALGAVAVSVANEYLNVSDVLIPGERCYFYTGQFVGPVPAAAKTPWKFTVEDLTHSWSGTHRRQQEDNDDYSSLYVDKGDNDDDRVQWSSHHVSNEQFWATCLMPAFNDRLGCCRMDNGKNRVGTTVTITEPSYAAATKACKEECNGRSTCTAVETRRKRNRKFVCEFHTAAGINAVTRSSKSCKKATCSVKR